MYRFEEKGISPRNMQRFRVDPLFLILGIFFLFVFSIDCRRRIVLMMTSRTA